jgi:glycosyltransferase involved in cell wall biosynthesis
MRVVHVSGDLGLYGAENVVALLMQHTSEPDIELVAMTLNRSEHPEARRRVGVDVVEVDRKGRYDLAGILRAVAALRRLKPAVVHTHAHHGRYWGRLAAVLAGVPIIVHTEHNPDLRPPAPRWFFSGLNRLLNPRTTAFIDFTPQRRADLAAAEGIPLERIAVIPNGIPALDADAGARERARAELGAGPGEILIVVVGRLFEQKRPDLAIDAVAALPEALRTRVRLALLGDGPLLPSLRERAVSSGIADQVRFPGFRTDARALLAGADVALLTSSREAMPLAIIEAMFAGVPIVSTPWDGADAMLAGGRYGNVASAPEPHAIAAALRDVVENPAAANQRAAAALAHASVEYDVATQARRYATLYRELSARTASASRVITAARS